MGKELGATYEEVKAYQASQGLAVYNTASDGREPTGGLYVLWDRDTGFTETGWYNLGSTNANTASPAYNYTDEQIKNEIDTNGNLNEMFSNWKVNVPDYKMRYGFMINTLPNGCVDD